jgi:hypothetical protein
MEIIASRERLHILQATSSNELKEKQKLSHCTSVREPSFAPLLNIKLASNRYNPLARRSIVG